MHFAMHAFSSHVEVLNEVTPIDLLVQSAVLFSLTGWSPGSCTMSRRLTYGLNRQLCSAPTGGLDNYAAHSG